MNELPEYRAYEVGDWTYGQPEVMDWHDGATLRVGKFCSIARGVRILIGGEHHTDWITTYPIDKMLPSFDIGTRQNSNFSKGNVVIGNDVWIGAGSTILSGVSIGNGAVIGAGSVVTTDVKAYAIFAGNPARVIRERFTREDIQALERIKWWEWPLEQICAAAPNLMSHNIHAFIAQHSSHIMQA